MVKFSPDNLYDYFTVATEKDSATLVGEKLFDFVDRQSDTLVITIGDSWTWGADLTRHDLKSIHIHRFPDDEYRIENVYGNVIAAAIDCDFLNLGESGSGNWYMVRKLKELLAIQSALTYKKILVFGVWTELGRDLNSSYDVDVDYRSWLLSHIDSDQDYYGFMEFINSHIAKNVSDIILKFDHRFSFYFGTNFVDPIGVDILSKYWIDQTWLQIICKSIGKLYQPNRCYTVFPWVIEKFNMVFDVAPELDRVEWLKWINDITVNANLRAAVCCRDNINFGHLLHPLASNHRVWAEYLLRKIKA